MNKKDILSKLYIVIFMGMLLSLSVLMPFSKSDMDKEKREAAKLPKLVKENKINLDFFNELTDYFSDNFAFRQELSTADALIKAKVFKTSNQERVVLGKDGWLYYSESMHDYLGEDLMSEREIHSAARVLYLLQENCEAKGVSFLFTIAPNKNSLYPEFMPDNYIKSDKPTNFERLRNDMLSCDINFVDLHTAFLNDERIMYHKWDSHWNNEGATFAVDLLLDELSKEHYDYTEEPYKIEASHRGDLYNILYPSLDALDDNFIYEKEHEYTYVNDVKSTEDPIILTQNPGAEGSLVMFRDSYGNATIPYIADEYQRGFFSKGQPVDLDQTTYQNADTVIYEIVERNIPWIIEYLPYMDAPRRELSDYTEKDYKAEGVEIIDNSKTTINIEDRGNRILVYGNVDESYIDDTSLIFVKVVSSDGEIVFEATPASFEKVEEHKEAEFVYGAYISKDELPDDYEIMIVTESKDKLYGFME
ncbi:MAG: hypothetical protein IJ224_11665 [Lachnospiraceae bacterium]|nr:hypothetical protein [Lachnospiraceae bacterium]